VPVRAPAPPRCKLLAARSLAVVGAGHCSVAACRRRVRSPALLYTSAVRRWRDRHVARPKLCLNVGRHEMILSTSPVLSHGIVTSTASNMRILAL